MTSTIILSFIDVPVLTNGLEEVPLEIVAPDLTKLRGKGCGAQFPEIIGLSSISSSSSSCKKIFCLYYRISTSREAAGSISLLERDLTA